MIPYPVMVHYICWEASGLPWASHGSRGKQRYIKRPDANADKNKLALFSYKIREVGSIKSAYQISPTQKFAFNVPVENIQLNYKRPNVFTTFF